MPRDRDIEVRRDHNARRAVWWEILLIYGLFIGLAIWNWW